MEPVSPQTGAPEIVIARDQHEYVPYPAALYRIDDRIVVLSRWRLTEEEREAVARGEDLFFGLMTDGRPVQPLYAQIGGDGWVTGNKPLFVCPGCHSEFAEADECRKHIQEQNCDMESATRDAVKLL